MQRGGAKRLGKYLPMKLNFQVLSLLFLLFVPLKGYAESPLVTAVKNYNSTLLKVYTTLDLNLLESVATTDEMSRVFPVVQALINKNSIMVAQQKYFKVLDSKVTGKKGYVVTEELWFYWWQNKKDGSITKPPSEAFYKIKYHLIKDKNTWKVDKIEEIR